MFYVFEKNEEKSAVLISDDKQTINVGSHLLPDEAKIGDVFVFDGEKYIFDPQETQKRKDRIVSKHRSIFDKK